MRLHEYDSDFFSIPSTRTVSPIGVFQVQRSDIVSPEVSKRNEFNHGSNLSVTVTC